MVTTSPTSTVNQPFSTTTSTAAAPTSSAYTGNSSSGTSATSTTTNSKLSLTPNDFVNMMITQLKNQDPTQPTSNADLLQEMSQIGQLQSQENLQTSLQSMVLQNQIGSASNFIGKSVSGVDSSSNNINGVVDSVHIENGGVNLVLDNGATLALNNLTDVDGVSTTATTTEPGATTTGTGTIPAASTSTTSTGTSTSTTAGG